MTDRTEIRHATIGLSGCYNFEVDEAATTIATGGDRSSVDFFDLASSRKYTVSVMQSYFNLSKMITDENGHNVALINTGSDVPAGVQMVSLQANSTTDTQTWTTETSKLDSMGRIISVSESYEPGPEIQRRLQVAPLEGGDPIAQVPLPAPARDAYGYTASTAISPDG